MDTNVQKAFLKSEATNQEIEQVILFRDKGRLIYEEEKNYVLYLSDGSGWGGENFFKFVESS